MEYGLDRAIERLNALKLQTPASQQQQAATADSNQHEESPQLHHQEQPTPAQLAMLQEQYSRMAQQMQEQYERNVKEQEKFFMERMQIEMQHMQRRVETLEHQNQLLRTAVSNVDTYKAQVADQQIVIDGLQDQVKQLRLTNYRLQFMVQQNDRSSGRPHQFMPPPPPDIF